MQRAVRKSKKAVWGARSGVGGQKNSIGHKELCGKGCKGCRRVPACEIFGCVTGKAAVSLSAGTSRKRAGLEMDGGRKRMRRGLAICRAQSKDSKSAWPERQCVIKSAKRRGRGYEDI